MTAQLRQRSTKTSTTTTTTTTTAEPVAAPVDTFMNDGHSHCHSGHQHDHAEEASALWDALQGGTDKGSRITLVGLAANLALTGVKGTAGLLLGSAALTADAVHSASDLLADIVTLITFRISRMPQDSSHPYGYGKYESLGSLVVAFLLVATALGIGSHSYQLLLTTLPSLTRNLSFLTALVPFLPHGHGGDHVDAGDARAMWFAAGSVLVKEYLYRITLKIAKQEHSNVLLANAHHHRSDAFSSLMVFIAIAGAWIGYPILDPLGGLLVTAAIIRTGTQVGLASLKELVDHTSDATLPHKVFDILSAIRDTSLPPLPAFDDDSASCVPSPLPATATFTYKAKKGIPLLSIPSIRVFATGPSLFVDLQLAMPKEMDLMQVGEVEKKITEACIEGIGGGRVKEVQCLVRGL